MLQAETIYKFKNHKNRKINIEIVVKCECVESIYINLLIHIESKYKFLFQTIL